MRGYSVASLYTKEIVMRQGLSNNAVLKSPRKKTPCMTPVPGMSAAVRSHKKCIAAAIGMKHSPGNPITCNDLDVNNQHDYAFGTMTSYKIVGSRIKGTSLPASPESSVFNESVMIVPAMEVTASTSTPSSAFISASSRTTRTLPNPGST
jgi:hypothetical protein